MTKKGDEMAKNDQVLNRLKRAGLDIRGGVIVDSPKPERCHVVGKMAKLGWYHLKSFQVCDGGAWVVGACGIWNGAANGMQSVRVKVKA